MDTRRSIIMLSNTGREMEVTSKPVRASSYFGRNNGLHTVSIQLANFTGEIKFQGTLSLNPTENDWFDINMMSKYNQAGPELRFPLDPKNPTSKLRDGGDTGVLAFSFVGHFTFIRVKVSRAYIGEIHHTNYEYLGSVDKILLAY